jgi:hypothetical protein
MKVTGLRPRNAKGRRRFGRAQDDHILDPYKRPRKIAEPTVCPQCGAVYQNGRWHWAARPRCSRGRLSTCHRINDHIPPALSLLRTYCRRKKTEMINLVRHQERPRKLSTHSTDH